MSIICRNHAIPIMQLLKDVNRKERLTECFQIVEAVRLYRLANFRIISTFPQSGKKYFTGNGCCLLLRPYLVGLYKVETIKMGSPVKVRRYPRSCKEASDLSLAEQINHCGAAAPREGAQNSEPEDLPFTITTFASGEKQR